MDLATLVEFREIEQLKYRYLRAVDTHDWVLMETCFAEDADVWFHSGLYEHKGRDNILAFFRGVIVPTFFGSHIALQPELKLASTTTATGTWRMQDIVHFKAANPNLKEGDIQGGEEMQGAGYYYDDYVKHSGEWLIKSSGYVRIFERISSNIGTGTHVNVYPEYGVRQ